MWILRSQGETSLSVWPPSLHSCYKHCKCDHKNGPLRSCRGTGCYFQSLCSCDYPVRNCRLCLVVIKVKYLIFSQCSDWFYLSSLRASTHPTCFPISLATHYLCTMFIYFLTLPVILRYYTIFALVVLDKLHLSCGVMKNKIHSR